MDHSEFLHACPVCKKPTAFRFDGLSLRCDVCGNSFLPRNLLQVELMRIRLDLLDQISDLGERMENEEAILLEEAVLPLMVGYTETVLNSVSKRLKDASDGELFRGALFFLSGIMVMDTIRMPTVVSVSVEEDLVTLKPDKSSTVQVKSSALMDIMALSCLDPFSKAMDLYQSGLKCLDVDTALLFHTYLGFQEQFVTFYVKVSLLDAINRFPFLNGSTVYTDVCGRLAEESLFLSPAENDSVNCEDVEPYINAIVKWQGLIDCMEVCTSNRIWETGQKYFTRNCADPAQHLENMSSVYQEAASLMPFLFPPLDAIVASVERMSPSLLQLLHENLQKVLAWNESMEQLLAGQPDRPGLVPKEQLREDRENWLQFEQIVKEEEAKKGLA